MQLRDWQESFQRGVLQPGHENNVLLGTLLHGAISKQLQFAIYQDAYVLRLLEALLANYPALHLLLGDSDFDQVGRDYLAQHPPTHASIRWFGDSVAQFLAHHSPYSKVPAIAELARFEWALRHTIDAADLDPVTVETLQAIAPERWGELRFVLHPSVTLLHLHWNAIQVWQALTGGLDAPAPQPAALSWIVYRRPDLVSSWRSISAAELAALECLGAGGNFADICEAVARQVSDAQEGAATSAGLLRLWVEQGLIALRNAAPTEGA